MIITLCDSFLKFRSFASAHDKGVLIIQSNADLSTTKSIDCCRYRLEQDIYELKKSITVVFVLQLLHSDEGKFSEYQVYCLYDEIVIVLLYAGVETYI